MTLIGKWKACETATKCATIIGASVGLVVVILIVCLIYHLVPKTYSGKITDANWTTVTSLEQKTKYHGEEWGEPWGKDIVAGSKSCQSKYYGQRRCYCTTHESCSGSGRTRNCTSHESCSSCPEYRDWCVYDYWEWPIVKSLTKTGTDQEPIWQEMTAADDNQRVVKSVAFSVQFDLEKIGNTAYSPTSLDEFKQIK